MSHIRETIVTTLGADGAVHIAPMGIRSDGDLTLLAPFRPSTTLDNIARSGYAVVNYTDDVRVFAGCLTGRYDWPTRAAAQVPGRVLSQALAHAELELVRMEADPVRPRLYCRTLHSATHAAFAGFNRAQAAVIEAAILVSRLHLLPAEKIDRELAYLALAVDKTAGATEREAWDWLCQRIAEHRAGAADRDSA